MRTISRALLLGAALAAAGCAGGAPPLSSAGSMRQAMAIIQMEHERYPEYSVILDDMDYPPTPSSDPAHFYRIVYLDAAGGTPALRETRTKRVRVTPDEYARHEDHLGMTLLARRAGTLDTVPTPPGYAFVGDSRYGQWRRDDDGGRFWEWYGQYALLRTLAGDGPIMELDFDHYRKHRRTHAAAPYFGRRKQYGSMGSYTAKTHPGFHARRTEVQAARNASFDGRVDSRVRRSGMSGFRSRSGGFGGK